MQNKKKSDCAVIYVSKYGATKKYAEIIAKTLSADLFDYQEMTNDSVLRKYRIIIWGGGIYAGKINGLQSLVKSAAKKHLIFPLCGKGQLFRADVW